MCRNAGLVFVDSDGNNVPDAYYFIDSDGCALTSTTLFIDSGEFGLPANYYRFGSDGKMVNESGEIMHIDSSNNYKITDSQGNLPSTNIHGLFAMQQTIGGTTHLVYIDASGRAIVNCTFYVNTDFINGYSVDGTSVTAGLYYFDSNGFMYDSSFTLIEGTLSESNIVTGGQS